MSSTSYAKGKIVFAKLELINPPGEWLMDQLGEHHAELPEDNRRNLHVKRIGMSATRNFHALATPPELVALTG